MNRNCAVFRWLAIAAAGVLDAQRLDLQALQIVFLTRMLPSSWQASAEVSWAPDGSQIPNALWLSKLWTWLQVLNYEQRMFVWARMLWAILLLGEWADR